MHISTYILCIHDINFLLIFFLIISASFFNLWQISKTFSNKFIEKYLHVSGPMQSKPVLFQGQLNK